MATFDPNAASAPESGVFGLPHSADEAHVILVPVPFEATTSYGGGTADGPAAVLEASRQVDLFDVETGRPYERGLHMLEDPKHVREWNDRAKLLALPIIIAGGVSDDRPDLLTAVKEVDALCEKMNEHVYETVKSHLAKGKRIALVGGDHGTPFGAIQAHAEKYPGMGVLHLDAHADFRDAYEGFTWSHASIMFNVAERIPGVSKIVQVGIRDLGESEHQYIEKSKGRVKTFFDVELQNSRFEGTPWKKTVEAIVNELPQQVYLSFDIDGLDPVLCPHTGTPVPGGLSFPEACALIAGVARSGREIVGVDLNEVSPGPEGNQWDGNVGARLLYKMIGWMLKTEKA